MGKPHTAQEVIETMRKQRIKMLAYYFYAWRKRIMSTVTLTKGSAETIRTWAREHKISLITSRRLVFNRQTRQWLNKHNIPYHELHHAREGTKFLKAKNCQVFIEDSFEECEILAQHCERVFLFDHPWNRKPLKQKNIIRVNSWPELREKL